MEVSGKVAIITGGGRGIGAAIAAALADHGARAVIADLDRNAAESVADAINTARTLAAVAWHGDVSDVSQIHALIARANDTFGPVDIYFANAGIGGPAGIGANEDEWRRAIDVNILAHVRAARILVPQWLERGHGYFVATASAAGLLTQIGAAAYSVTKHAAVAFAEWLRVTYGDAGLRVSCLCPMGVNTQLLYGGTGGLDALVRHAVTGAGEVLEPADVAKFVLDAIADERFLILPHPQVLEMYRHKGSDYDRWLRGMQRYRRSLHEAGADGPG